VHPRQSKSPIFYDIERSGRWELGVVNFSSFCLCFEAMTKNVVNFFEEEKCTPQKILATPMVLKCITSKYVKLFVGKSVLMYCKS